MCSFVFMEIVPTLVRGNDKQRVKSFPRSSVGMQPVTLQRHVRQNHRTSLFRVMVTTTAGKTVDSSMTLTSAVATKPGDCDNSGTVTIVEVQSAINMFLGLKPVESCVNVEDVSGVSIAEVQKVINSFLGL